MSIQDRPFVRLWCAYEKVLTHRTYLQEAIFPFRSKPGFNIAIGFSGLASSKPFSVMAVDRVPSYDLLEKTQFLPRCRINVSGQRVDNITDWALAQFQARYPDAAVTKDGIFAYTYAALHDPVWRETYAADLKRAFPRIMLHDDFEAWRAWGETLLALHIGYETVEPWPLPRVEVPGKTAPKPILKSKPEDGVIVLDTDTQLTGVPRAAWDYRLGNRSGIDWVLDQHKEKRPRDPTVAARFNTYRFADHKERVVDLLARVVRVSVETVAIVEAMRAARTSTPLAL